MKKKAVNKKIGRNTKRSISLIKKSIIALIVGIVLLFLAFGSGIAFQGSKIPVQIPVSTQTPTQMPTSTVAPVITLTTTQQPQSTYTKEQCLNDAEKKLITFRNAALSQGHSEGETNAFVEMARAAEVQKCNSGYYSNPKNTIEKRLDSIEDELKTRKEWEITCGDRGYNVMTGSCNYNTNY